jgi:hypothetical protein
MIEKIPNEWRYRDSETGMFYPWYTKPCLEWLLTLDLKGKKVFEYGCGDSTFWYRSKGAEVKGVDNNLSWATECDVTYECGGDLAFPVIILEHKDKFDIVVIDGISRDRCTEYALSKLKPGGYLIIDNYKQPSVQEHWPRTEKLIEGMPITIYKEPDHYDWQTAVITKP